MPTFHHEHALQVQTAVGSLRESAVNRTSHLQKEISTAQDLTSSVREKWGFYMEETEKNYAEDTKAVDSGRSCLAEVLVEWSVHFSVMPCDGGYSFWFEDADVLNFFFFYIHPEICCSKAKATVGAQQWKNAEDSLFSLGKGNVESVDSIVR